MAAYEVLLLNTAIPQIQAAQAGDTYVCPRDIQITANLDVTGNTTLGNASTDTVRVNGYMGVGGSPNSQVSIGALGSSLTGANQYAFQAAIQGNSAATTSINGFYSAVATTAESFTCANLRGVWIASGAIGAGSAVTNKHGLFVSDQTGGTNNYGITSQVSSGTDKWNIYASGTAANYFAGNLAIGSTTQHEVVSLSNTSGARISFEDQGTRRYTIGNSGTSFTLTDASASADRLTFATDAAVFNDPGNDYDFRVESDTNTHALFVDAGNSRVGFGTASPNTDVEISTTVDPILRLNNSTNTVTAGADIGEIQFYTNDASTSGTGVKAFVKTVAQAFGANQGGADLVFGTAAYAVGDASEKMRIDKDGNVGIGTSLPSAKVHIAGVEAADYATALTTNSLLSNAAPSSFLYVQNDNDLDGTFCGITFNTTRTGGGGNTAYIANIASSSNNAGILAFGTRSGTNTLAERLRIDSSGNVGIGTSAPQSILDVVGVSGTEQFRIGNTLGGTDFGITVTENLSAIINSAEGATGRGIQFQSGGTNTLLIDSAGNVKIGGTADRATTGGTNHLDIFNGTAPVGTLTNGISIYSSSGEAYVMDAAGNATLFSPHDKETNEWIFKSKHTPTGKVLKIDVEKLLRFVNNHFGLDAIQEFIEE